METEGQPEDQLADELLKISQRRAELEASQREPQLTEEPLEKADDFTFMSALLDESGLLIVVLDQEGRVRGFSRACEEATGYAFEDVWGRYVWDLLLIPEEVELVKGVLEKLRAGQRSIEYEGYLLAKDGSRRLIAWSSTGLLDGNGSLEYVIETGMDITENRRAEKALRGSEERYHQLVESSPYAILVHRRGDVLFANKAAVTLLGASSPDQVIGKPVLDFIHPDKRPIVKERLQKILEQGTELPLIEDKLIRLDDTEVYVKADSIFPFMYEGQQALQVVAREVTGAKEESEDLPEAEERLRESEYRYRWLFEANVAGIYHATLDGRFLACNDAFAQMLGYESQEEVLALRPSEVYLDPAERDAFVTQLRQQGHLTNFEFRLRRRDGSPVRVLENASLIRDADGPTMLVQGTLIEVAGQQEVERETPDARQVYDALVKISGGAVMATDLRGRIADVSDRTLELYGYKGAEELIGKSAFELIAAEDHEKAIANLQKALKEGVVTNTECTLLRKDGSRFVAALDTALIRDTQGKPKAFVNIARKLTKPQLAPEAMRRSAEEGRESDREASWVVLEGGEFEDAAQAVFDSCKALIGASAGYVTLLKEDGAQDEVVFLEPGALVGEVDAVGQMPMRGLHGEVYRTRRAVYRNGLSRAEATHPATGGQSSLENVLLAPLVIEGRAVGLLAFANKPGGFTENDVRIASSFGELAAIALHNNQTMEALEASEARFRSVSEIGDRAIVTVDRRESIVSWNRGAEASFGYSADEAVGKRLTIAATEELWKAYQNVMPDVASAGGFAIVAEAVEMVGRRKDGSEFPLELSLVAWKAREGIFLTASIRDITQRRLVEEAVRQLAGHDPMTGLANRALFTDLLRQALVNMHRTDRKLAIVMLDLDRFMDVNHTLGHDMGDRLLHGAANRLTGLVRAGDTVARLGGDEFMLLLPGIAEAEHATKIAQKVLEAFRKPFLLDEHEVHITASIGIAVYPDDGEDVDTLTRNADLAMCGVKEEGGNNFQRFAPTRDVRGGEGMVLVT